MTLNEFIAQLQFLRSQDIANGDLQVWVLPASPAGPRAYVGEMSPDLQSPVEKVVFVE